MIIGTGKYLTDAQLLKLMEIVSDDKPIYLELPKTRRDVARLERDGMRYLVFSDGSVRKENM